jgi:hypothetical protein
MSEAVRHAPSVLQLEMPQITLDNVSGTIYYTGDKAALRQQLEAQAIVVHEEGTQWTLSVR